MSLLQAKQGGVEVVGRLAPSPSGRVHAGNIFSALISWLLVRRMNGRLILRIEDLDEQRCKPEYAQQIMRDFDMLGLTWDNEDVLFQSTRQERYIQALECLRAHGCVYPCFCTRADIKAASAPHDGESIVYPGTCRNLDVIAQQARMQTELYALRLAMPNINISIDDLLQGSTTFNLQRHCGDCIIRRRDGMFAYQLAVVVDDLDQGVNLVVRGRDLLVSSAEQQYIRSILDDHAPENDTVSYAHTPLLVDAEGRRLSKRDADAGLDELLERYSTPEGVIGHIAFVAGLQQSDTPCTAEDLLQVPLDSLAGVKNIAWR